MIIYYLIISVITFVIWGLDKYRAINGQWRVPEKWLLALTMIGGGFGSLAGMLLFRHKIRKPGFWVIVGIACVIHGWILTTQVFANAI